MQDRDCQVECLNMEKMVCRQHMLEYTASGEVRRHDNVQVEEEQERATVSKLYGGAGERFQQQMMKGSWR